MSASVHFILLSYTMMCIYNSLIWCSGQYRIADIQALVLSTLLSSFLSYSVQITANGSVLQSQSRFHTHTIYIASLFELALLPMMLLSLTFPGHVVVVFAAFSEWNEQVGTVVSQRERDFCLCHFLLAYLHLYNTGYQQLVIELTYSIAISGF